MHSNKSISENHVKSLLANVIIQDKRSKRRKKSLEMLRSLYSIQTELSREKNINNSGSVLVSLFVKFLDEMALDGEHQMENKKLVLAVCQTLLYVHSVLIKKLQDDDDSDTSYAAQESPDDLQQMLSSLLHIVQFGGRVIDDRKQPTRLTIAAADTALLLLYSAARRQLFNVLWKALDMSIVLIEELVQWNSVHRPLLVEGLKHVHQLLRNVLKFKDYVMAAENVEKIRDDRAINAANNVLASIWTMFVPYMVDEDGIFFSHRKTQIVEYVSAFIMEVSEILSPERSQSDHGDSDAEKASYCLASICLLLGKFLPKQLHKILGQNESIVSSLQQVSTFGMHARDEQLQKLSVYLFREVLRQMEIPPDKLQEMIPSLMTLLDTHDTVSHAVVAMLAEMLVANPSNGMEQVFFRLSSGSSAQKKNVLNLLEEVIKLSHGLAQWGKKLQFMLAENLLQHLHDEELQTRIQASELFAHLDLEFIVPRLVQLEFSRDTNLRSAAHRSLERVLASHSESERAFFVLLNAVQDMSIVDSSPKQARPKNSIVTPGDIGIQEAKTGDSRGSASQVPAMDLVDRVFSVIFVQRWAKSVSLEVFGSVIRSLIGKVFESPHNPLLVNVLSKLMRQEQSVVRHRQLILDKVLLSLKEHHYAPVVAMDQHEKQQHLFHRLSPLLVLKTLPLACFANHTETTSEMMSILFNLLTGGAGEDKLFEQVYRVAAEVLARFPPSSLVPQATQLIEELVERAQFRDAKMLIFTMVNSIAIYGSKHRPYANSVQRICLRVLGVPCLPGNVELEKLQMGCIECLGMLIGKVCLYVEATHNDSNQEGSPIQEIHSTSSEEEEEEEEFIQQAPSERHDFSIVDDLVSILKTEPRPEDPQLQICVLNALTTSVRNMQLKQLMQLANRLCGTMQNIITDREKRPTIVRSAGLQFLLHLTYQLKEAVHPHCRHLLQSVQYALSASGADEGQLRLAGLKLLGAVLAVRDDVLVHLPHIMEPILKDVESLAIMDSSEQVRALAQKLHEILMKG